MRVSTILIIGCLLATLTPTMASAQTVDPDARVVELRESCLVNGVALDNCFEHSPSSLDATSKLTHWLWGSGPGTRTNEPNALDPVTVRVGPGKFDAFKCDSAGGIRGFVSVVGSGRDVTHFEELTTIHLFIYDFGCSSVKSEQWRSVTTGDCI